MKGTSTFTKRIIHTRASHVCDTEKIFVPMQMFWYYSEIKWMEKETARTAPNLEK
jgi:hypothetical protein